jgi:hypothetical protein
MTGMLVLTLVTGVLLGTTQVRSDELPDGDGRDVVEYVCTQCHGLVEVTAATKSAEQWRYLVRQMINQGAPIEEHEIDRIVHYLTEHFGER